MTSKRSVRCVARSTLPHATHTPPAATTSSAGVRACGCAHRFLPTLPLHSQSAPARRRSRSSTGSSSKSARSVSSGRNTPSPSPHVAHTSLKHKAMSESHLADITAPPLSSQNRIEESDKSEPQPIFFSSSVLIRLSANKQHFLEQVKYEMRYGPPPTQEHATLDQSQQFRTELEIQVDNPSVVESTSNQT